MKWEFNSGALVVPTPTGAADHRARCGHLYVRIKQKRSKCEWFVEPDDDDKSYRRALATGDAPTVEAAKQEVAAVCKQLIAEMQASLCEEPA